jgi:hypothetical protein
MRLVVVGLVTGLALANTAAAQSVQAGRYLCSVEQLAGIGSTHLEGAGPPDAFTSAELYRFRILVTPEADGRLRVVEAPNNGPQQSTRQWEDDNSTLHTAYFGDGRAFRAEEGTGFLNFGHHRWGEGLQFFHSGFQYAGGEDESVAVRWGRCARE